MMAPDRKGKFEDVILGYDSVEHYLTNPPHLGAPIGRNANRIGGANVTIDGVDYPLAGQTTITAEFGRRKALRNRERAV